MDDTPYESMGEPPTAEPESDATTPRNTYYVGSLSEGIETDMERINKAHFPARDGSFITVDPKDVETSHDQILYIYQQWQLAPDSLSRYKDSIHKQDDLNAEESKIVFDTLTTTVFSLFLNVSNLDMDNLTRVSRILTIVVGYMGRSSLETLLPLPMRTESGLVMDRQLSDCRLGPTTMHDKCGTCGLVRNQCLSHNAVIDVGEILDPYTADNVFNMCPVKCQHCPNLLVDSGSMCITPDRKCRLFNDVPLPWTESERQVLDKICTRQYGIQIGGQFLTAPPVFHGAMISDPSLPLGTPVLCTVEETRRAANQFQLPPEIGPMPDIPERWSPIPDSFTDLHQREVAEYQANVDVWRTVVDKWRCHYLIEYAAWCEKMDRIHAQWERFWTIRVRVQELLAFHIRTAQMCLEFINSRRAPSTPKNQKELSSKEARMLFNRQVQLYYFQQRCWELETRLHDYKRLNMETFGGLLHARNEEQLRYTSYNKNLGMIKCSQRACQTEGRVHSLEYINLSRRQEEMQRHIAVCTLNIATLDAFVLKGRQYLSEAVYARERVTGRMVVQGKLREWMQQFTNPFARPDGAVCQVEPRLGEIQKNAKKRKKGEEDSADGEEKKKEVKVEMTSKKKKKTDKKKKDELIHQDSIFFEGHDLRTLIDKTGLVLTFLIPPSMSEMESVSLFGLFQRQSKKPDPNLTNSYSSRLVQESRCMQEVIKQQWSRMQKPNVVEDYPDGVFLCDAITFGGCGFYQANISADPTTHMYVAMLPSFYSIPSAMPGVGQFYHNEIPRQTSVTKIPGWMDDNFWLFASSRHRSLFYTHTPLHLDEDKKMDTTSDKEEEEDMDQKRGEKAKKNTSKKRRRDRDVDKPNKEEEEVMVCSAPKCKSKAVIEAHVAAIDEKHNPNLDRKRIYLCERHTYRAPVRVYDRRGVLLPQKRIETYNRADVAPEQVVKRVNAATQRMQNLQQCLEKHFAPLRLDPSDSEEVKIEMDQGVDGEPETKTDSSSTPPPLVPRIFYPNVYATLYQGQERRDWPESLVVEWQQETFFGYPYLLPRFLDRSMEMRVSLGQYDLENDDMWIVGDHIWPVENVHFRSMFQNLSDDDQKRLGRSPTTSRMEWSLMQTVLLPCLNKFRLAVIPDTSGLVLNTLADSICILYQLMVRFSTERQNIEHILYHKFQLPPIAGEWMQNRNMGLFGSLLQSLLIRTQNQYNRIVLGEKSVLPVPVPRPPVPGRKSTQRTGNPHLRSDGIMMYSAPKPSTSKPKSKKDAKGGKKEGSKESKPRKPPVSKAKVKPSLQTMLLNHEWYKRWLYYWNEKRLCPWQVPPFIIATLLSSEINLDNYAIDLFLEQSDAMLAINQAQIQFRDPENSSHLKVNSHIERENQRNGSARMSQSKTAGSAFRAIQTTSPANIDLAIVGSTICAQLPQSIANNRDSAHVIETFVNDRCHSQSILNQQHSSLRRLHMTPRGQGGFRRSLYMMTMVNPDLVLGRPFPSILSVHKASGGEKVSTPFQEYGWAKNTETGDTIRISTGVQLFRPTDTHQRNWRYSKATPDTAHQLALNIAQWGSPDARSSIVAPSPSPQDGGKVAVLNTNEILERRSPVFQTMLNLSAVVGRPGGYVAISQNGQESQHGDYDGDPVAAPAPQTLAAIFSARRCFPPKNLTLRFQCGSSIGLLQDQVAMWSRLCTLAPLPWAWLVSLVGVLELYSSRSPKDVVMSIYQRRWKSDKTFHDSTSRFYTRLPLSRDGSNYLDCGWDVRDLLLHMLPTSFTYTRGEAFPLVLPSPIAASPTVPLSTPLQPPPQSPPSTGVKTCTTKGCEVHIECGWLLHGVLVKADLGTGFAVLCHQMAIEFGVDDAARFINDAIRLCELFHHWVPWNLSADDRWLPMSVYREVRQTLYECRLKEQQVLGELHDSLDASQRRFFSITIRPGHDDHGRWLSKTHSHRQLTHHGIVNDKIMELAGARSDALTNIVKKFVKSVVSRLPLERNEVVLTVSSKSRGNTKLVGLTRLAQVQVNEWIEKHSLQHHPHPMSWTIPVENEDELERAKTRVRETLDHLARYHEAQTQDKKALEVWGSLFNGFAFLNMMYSGSKGKVSDWISLIVGLELQTIDGSLMEFTSDGRLTAYDAHGDGVDARGAAHNSCFAKGISLGTLIKSNIRGGWNIIGGQMSVYIAGMWHRNFCHLVLDHKVMHNGTVMDSSGNIICITVGHTNSNATYDLPLPMRDFIERIKELLSRFQDPHHPWHVQPQVVQQTAVEYYRLYQYQPLFEGDSILAIPERGNRFGSIYPSCVSSPKALLSKKKKSTKVEDMPNHPVTPVDPVKTEPNPPESSSSRPILDPQWANVLQATTLERFKTSVDSQLDALAKDARECIEAHVEMIYHLHSLSVLNSVDPNIRCPFKVENEISRVLIDTRADPATRLADGKSDLLPTDIVSKRTAFLQLLHSHMSPTFFAMKTHGIDMGQRVIEWYVLHKINCKSILVEHRMTRTQYEMLLTHLFVRFQKSRNHPGNLASLKAATTLEVHEQGTLQLKNSLTRSISGTEGIPRLVVLMGLTQNQGDFTLSCRLRTEAETPKNTGYVTVWENKLGLTEEEKIIGHFVQMDPRHVFPQVVAVDYEEDTRDLTAPDWLPYRIDQDESRWEYPEASRFAFCIVIDVLVLHRHGCDIVRILQRIRTSLGYEWLLTARTNVQQCSVRVYGRLVSRDKDLVRRMKGAEELHLSGMQVKDDRVIHQYNSQAMYFERVGVTVAELCLPKTGFLRVSWTESTRTVKFLLDKRIHNLSFLQQFCMRPEIVPQSVRFGDLSMTNQYYGILMARQMLEREYTSLTFSLQYVSPFAPIMIAATQTSDGRLVPLDWRSLQQRGDSDSLVEGSLNRGKQAAQKAAREGRTILLDRSQSSFMFGRPSTSGSHFQQVTLETSPEYTNVLPKSCSATSTSRDSSSTHSSKSLKSFLSRHDTNQMDRSELSQWDENWNSLVGHDDMIDVMSTQRNQYDIFPNQDAAVEDWVGSDPEVRQLYRQQIITQSSEVRQLLDYRQTFFVSSMVENANNVLQRLMDAPSSPLPSETTLITQSSRMTRAFLIRHKEQIVSCKADETEIEARFLSTPFDQGNGLDLNRDKWLQLRDSLIQWTGIEPTHAVREDTNSLMNNHRYRIEMPNNRWCLKKRRGQYVFREGDYTCQLSIMDEKGWTSEKEKASCPHAMVFGGMESNPSSSVRVKEMYTFVVDGIVELRIDETREIIRDGEGGEEAEEEEEEEEGEDGEPRRRHKPRKEEPPVEYHIEMEWIPHSVGLNPVGVYTYLKYVNVLSQLVSTLLTHQFTPSSVTDLPSDES